MCLALPAKVLSVDKEAETAVVALGPVKKEISTALLDEVRPGTTRSSMSHTRCTRSRPRKRSARSR
jgi:hypothetical protein